MGGGVVVKGFPHFALTPFRSFPLFFPLKNLMLMLLQNFYSNEERIVWGIVLPNY